MEKRSRSKKWIERMEKGPDVDWDNWDYSDWRKYKKEKKQNDDNQDSGREERRNGNRVGS